MPAPFEIENIERLRWNEGIDDVALRREIRSLRVGDSVKLTFRTDTKSLAGKTLLVRITSIKGCTFRGKLTMTPVLVGLAKLREGSRVSFTTVHIHSIVKRQPKHKQ
jgi:hypothetical protein